MYFPKREELLFRIVFALPNASSTGLALNNLAAMLLDPPATSDK